MEKKNTNKIVSIAVVAVIIIVAVIMSIVLLNKSENNNENKVNQVENNQIQMDNVTNNSFVGPIDGPVDDVPENPISTPTEENGDSVQDSVSTQ